MPADHDSLQRRVAELTELAGGLAHELRNPLATVMLNLQLLAEDLQNEQSRPEDVRRRALLRVNGLQREAERLQALFDEFLRLAGSWSIQTVTTDLRPIIRRLVEFLEPLLHAHKIEAVVRLPDEPVTCRVDEKLLSQALLNIVINAQQAMPHGGTLGIELDPRPDSVSVRISDTGMGIAKDDYERILRPFFSTKAGGTGLGLSLVKRIVEEHGGSLRFESELGRGTTFTVTLPLAASPSG
jgi:signal transduction histidine kinase